MKVTVLGCGAAYPRPGGATTGYLVQGGGVTLWIDAGNGTYARGAQLLDIADVDALVITHRHADHIADAPPISFARWKSQAGAMPVFTCQEVIDALEPLTVAAVVDEAFAWRDLSSGFTCGGLSVEVFRTVHPVECYGLRITDGDKRFVFTADTAWYDGLPDDCRGADLLVCEANFVRPIEFRPDVHLWADEAGRVAAAAQPGRFVLTHIDASIEVDAAIAEASSTYGGLVEAAVEGAVYTL